jgi:hypothetical protein
MNSNSPVGTRLNMSRCWVDGLMKEVLSALSPFAATALAAGAAWLALQSTAAGVAIVLVAVLMIVFFAAAFDAGQRSLPNSPVSALTLMNLSRGLHWIVAALGSMLVIVIGVKLAPGETLSASDEATFAAFATGVTAFITTTTAKYSDEKSDDLLAERTRAAFQQSYKRRPSAGQHDNSVHCFAASSAGERWVYAESYRGASGWGKSSRRKRAEGIAAELKSGDSEPS